MTAKTSKTKEKEVTPPAKAVDGKRTDYDLALAVLASRGPWVLIQAELDAVRDKAIAVTRLDDGQIEVKVV